MSFSDMLLTMLGGDLEDFCINLVILVSMILKMEKRCLMASSKNAAKDSRIFSREKWAGRQKERQADEDIKVYREMIGVIPVRLQFPCPLEVLKALEYPEDT